MQVDRAILSVPGYFVQLPGKTVPLAFVRKPRSRRYILRVLRDGTARVSIPRGGTIGYAMEFVEKHRSWIEKQLARARPAWAAGSSILYRGVECLIEVFEEGHLRRVRLGGLDLALLSGVELAPAVQAHLRQLATPELISRTFELAAIHALKPKSVQVRDQRSRWGSCSSKGRISLNWRLIQTPDSVRDYIVIHELMHLRELNHSERFWKLVEGACLGYRDAERWLRTHSSLLA